jgi:hypothetical protein
METKTISVEIIDFLKKYKKTFWFGGDLERRLSGIHKPSTIARALRQLTEGEPKEWKIHKDYEKVGKVIAVKYKHKD